MPVTTPDTFWDLFFGYSVFWVIVAVFIFRIMREQSQLGQRLRESTKSQKQ